MALMVGPDEGEFAWHEISTRVNQFANDDPQLVLPITDEQREAEAPKPKKLPRARRRRAAAMTGRGACFKFGSVGKAKPQPRAVLSPSRARV